MSAVSIRNLDDGVKERLRLRAARHGRSMEAEMRAILTEAVSEPGAETGLLPALWTGSVNSVGWSWTFRPELLGRVRPISVR